MPRLGQHFLKSKPALRKIVDALELREGDFVVEIGPGHGELTSAIMSKAPSRVIAIERDARLAQLLRAMFLKTEGAKIERMTVAEGDALEILPNLVREKMSGKNPWKLAGNIPYYITGKLLRISANWSISRNGPCLWFSAKSRNGYAPRRRA